MWIIDNFGSYLVSLSRRKHLFVLLGLYGAPRKIYRVDFVPHSTHTTDGLCHSVLHISYALRFC